MRIKKEDDERLDEVPCSNEEASDTDRLLQQIEELKFALANEKERSEAFLNQTKYLQADIENYRRRVNKDVDRLIDANSERIVSSLIEPVDELELAIEASKNKADMGSLILGLEMLLAKLRGILLKEGISAIESTGSDFDPNRHQAVATVPVTDKSLEGKVVKEVRKGYTFRGRVLKPSMVEVARLQSQEESEESR